MSGEARKGSPAESSARDGDARDLQPATRAAAAWNALNTIFTRLSSIAITAVILRLISPSDFGVWGPRWALLGSARAYALRISGPARPTYPRRPLLLETDGIVT